MRRGLRLVRPAQSRLPARTAGQRAHPWSGDRRTGRHVRGLSRAVCRPSRQGGPGCRTGHPPAWSKRQASGRGNRPVPGTACANKGLTADGCSGARLTHHGSPALDAAVPRIRIAASRARRAVADGMDRDSGGRPVGCPCPCQGVRGRVALAACIAARRGRLALMLKAKARAAGRMWLLQTGRAPASPIPAAGCLICPQAHG